MILPGKFCWRRTSAQIRDVAPALTQKCHVIRNAKTQTTKNALTQISLTHIPPPSSTTVCVNPGTAAPIALILFSCPRVWIKHTVIYIKKYISNYASWCVWCEGWPTDLFVYWNIHFAVVNSNLQDEKIFQLNRQQLSMTAKNLVFLYLMTW